jgi:hypothetical protein
MSELKSKISDARERRRRQPVWKAFSELFLDTQLEDRDIRRIAGIAADSGYTVEELHDIYLLEVAPAVGRNLRSIAGEWAGFTEEWLYAQCAGRANRRTPFVSFRAFIHRRFCRSDYCNQTDWNRVVQRIDEIRRIKERDISR